ncbi:hypothetical protein EKD04_019825 [Chloroflexales bacterium ZM16-3]|nr:hypothetical protein [Chloroflexales bacterium ZM16-3]
MPSRPSHWLQHVVRGLIIASIGLLSACATVPVAALPTPIVIPTVTPTVALSPTPLPPTSTPEPQPSASADLRQILRLTPADATRVAFTDWAVVKAALKETAITGQSDLRERLAFLRTMSFDWDALSLCGATNIRTPEADWGWDTMDALWDATIDLDNQRSVCAIAFPADSDPRLSLQWYADLGFAPSDYRGTTIYSGTAELLPQSIVSLHGQQAVALLADRHLLLLSDARENLYRVLDADAGAAETFLDHPAALVAAETLGAAGSAVIVLGAQACQQYSRSFFEDPTRMTRRGAEFITTAVGPELAAVHAYEALAFGYRYEAGEPVILYGFAYADPAPAAADVPTREALAAKGVAHLGQRLYSKYIFTPISSKADGATLLVRLRRATERLQVMDVFAKREMLVAACPS